jgi:hypothetical protein
VLQTYGVRQFIGKPTGNRRALPDLTTGHPRTLKNRSLSKLQSYRKVQT